MTNQVSESRLVDLQNDVARLEAKIKELVANGAEFFDAVVAPLIEERSEKLKLIKGATAIANVGRVNEAKSTIQSGFWQLVDSTELAQLMGERIDRIAVERPDPNDPNGVSIIRVNGKVANGDKNGGTTLRRRLAICFSECATDDDREMMRAALDAQKSGLKFNNREHTSRSMAENYVRDIVYVREHKDDRTVHQPS
jgi:hypothetical protein